MITEFTLKNFKSYKNATLKLGPLTVLIGANASGKSNALEALRFLSWLAQGKKLIQLQYEVTDSDRIFRGDIEDLFNSISKPLEFEIIDNENRWDSFNIGIKWRNSELAIFHESIRSTKEKFPLYQKAKGSRSNLRGNIDIVYNNFRRGGKKPIIQCLNDRPVFSQLSSSVRFPSEFLENKFLNIAWFLT